MILIRQEYYFLLDSSIFLTPVFTILLIRLLSKIRFKKKRYW